MADVMKVDVFGGVFEEDECVEEREQGRQEYYG